MSRSPLPPGSDATADENARISQRSLCGSHVIARYTRADRPGWPGDAAEFHFADRGESTVVDLADTGATSRIVAGLGQLEPTQGRHQA